LTLDTWSHKAIGLQGTKPRNSLELNSKDEERYKPV